MNDRASSSLLRNVLLLQGGGALGAYQLGVIEALQAAGRTPEWVVGTSIGAINGALLAGNPPHRRIERLQEFWSTVARGTPRGNDPLAASVIGAWQGLETLLIGVPGFFFPRLGSLFALGLPTQPSQASFYDVTPLRHTLERLIDFDFLAHSPIRLSVGAVNVESGEMRYFDSARERLTVDHILASGALPPAFPPVKIGEHHYWDGGIYSNTPLEHVLHDLPRRSSLCFLASLWPEDSEVPEKLSAVLARSKDIQFASRTEALMRAEQETHRLRHALAMLADQLPEQSRTPETRALAALGCNSVFHVVPLQTPHLPGEDQWKDIEFVAERIQRRRDAGRADTRAALLAQQWTCPARALEGVVVHDPAQPEPVTV